MAHSLDINRKWVWFCKTASPSIEECEIKFQIVACQRKYPVIKHAKPGNSYHGAVQTKNLHAEVHVQLLATKQQPPSSLCHDFLNTFNFSLENKSFSNVGSKIFFVSVVLSTYHQTKRTWKNRRLIFVGKKTLFQVKSLFHNENFRLARLFTKLLASLCKVSIYIRIFNVDKKQAVSIPSDWEEFIRIKLFPFWCQDDNVELTKYALTVSAGLRSVVLNLTSL